MDENKNTTKKNTEAPLDASRMADLERTQRKLSICSCLITRMQDTTDKIII
jgi:hypothetical protein